jgi:hypothetical protein
MSSRASWRLSIYLLSYPMHSRHGTAFQTITTFAPRRHTSTSAWVSHTYLAITATSIRHHHRYTKASQALLSITMSMLNIII